MFYVSSIPPTMSFSGIPDNYEETFLNLPYADLMSLAQTDQHEYTLCTKDTFWQKKFQREFDPTLKPVFWSYQEFYKKYYQYVAELKDGLPNVDDFAFVSLVAPPFDLAGVYEEGPENGIVITYQARFEHGWATQEVIDCAIDENIPCHAPFAECALNRFAKLFGLHQLQGIVLTLD